MIKNTNITSNLAKQELINNKLTEKSTENSENTNNKICNDINLLIKGKENEPLIKHIIPKD